MPNITISIPAGLVADARAVLKAMYEREGSATMTDRELVALHLRTTLGPGIKARRKAAIDLSALDAVQAAAALEIEKAQADRKAALSTADAQADTDILGVG